MKINNNILVGGLFLALILVIGGTWISLNYIDSLSGAATSGTGTVNLTITSVVSCTMTDNLVSFGAMARGDSNTSNHTNVNSTGYPIGDFMVLENNGNVNITINVNTSKELWTSTPAASGNWLIRCESDSDTNATCNSTYAQVVRVSSLILETGLTPLDGNADNITIGFNITVPNDEPAGAKNGTVTFYCSETA